jgi:hypothetical protein
MNINDYSTKVKNLADALASVGTPIDDDDLVAVTLNGVPTGSISIVILASSVLQLQFEKHFPTSKI